MKCLRCLLRRGESPAVIEELVRQWVREEIAKREQQLAREIEAIGFAKLISWGRPPPPLDRGGPP